MAITGFDVAIGTQDVWRPVELVPVDNSRTLTDYLPSSGKEFRYWRLRSTENGVTEEVEGRLLVAGSLHVNPPVGAVVVDRGDHRTWTRVQTTDEVIIDSAGTLSVI